MSQSLSNYLSISVALEGAGAQPAGFGSLLFVSDHVVTTDRLNGPYTSLAAMVSAGFVAGAAEYAFAQAVFSQQPRTRRLYIGRRAGGDASLAASLDAILAVDPGAWYCLTLESRTDADNLALAAWAEAQTKIAIAQSSAASLVEGDGASYDALFGGTVADGTYILTFTGFGLIAPVAVTVTRAAGTPATLALIAEDMADALEIEAGVAGDLEGVIVLDSIDNATVTTSFSIAGGLPPGTVVASGTAVASTADLTVTTTDAGIGQVMFAANYTRTALVYHSDDSVQLAGAWAARCLAFDLDVQKGGWSYKRLNGIAGDALDDEQIAALRSVNANYFAPAVTNAGVQIQAFTAQGWMPSGDAGAGRRIDVTTSLDWLAARLEEATISVNLRATHDVPFTDAGINRFYAAWSNVLNTGVKAGHLVVFVVPEGEDQEGTSTPYLDVPTLAETTTAQRVARTLSATGLVYLRSSIERVNLAIEARQ